MPNTTQQQLKALRLKQEHPELSSAQVAEEVGATKDQVQKWLRRSGATQFPKVETYRPFRLTGNYLVVADIHSYTCDLRLLAKAEEMGEEYDVDGVIIAGDLMCQGKYSKHPVVVDPPSLNQEIDACRIIVSRLATAFSNVKWMLGNHDRRLLQVLRGDLSADKLGDLVLPGADRDCLEVNPCNYAWLTSGKQKWLVSHQFKYSTEAGSVAAKLAARYHCNVIHHHQHLCGARLSHDGLYTCIDNGCLSREDITDYTTLDISDLPPFQGGFTIIKEGRAYPYVQNGLWGIS